MAAVVKLVSRGFESLRVTAVARENVGHSLRGPGARGLRGIALQAVGLQRLEGGGLVLHGEPLSSPPGTSGQGINLETLVRGRFHPAVGTVERNGKGKKRDQ